MNLMTEDNAIKRYAISFYQNHRTSLLLLYLMILMSKFHCTKCVPNCPRLDGISKNNVCKGFKIWNLLIEIIKTIPISIYRCFHT